MPPDLPNAHGLAVDWVSRNLFWTSYDTNKKQINVARLDGSFKNAVVQGLEQPHGLVVHPLRGSVSCSSGLRHTCVRREEEDPYPLLGSFPSKLYWTDGDNISMANMDGSNRTLLFSGQKGPVGMHLPCLFLQARPLAPQLGDAPGISYACPHLGLFQLPAWCPLSQHLVPEPQGPWLGGSDTHSSSRLSH